MARTERVLLVGGPFHFRTIKVNPKDYEIHIVLPTEQPLMVAKEHSFEYEPASIDLKSARYVRGHEFVYEGEHLGFLFFYRETT